MPSTTKGKKLTQWTVAQKMEAVQARQRGLTIKEVKSLFGVCDHTLYKWVKAYDSGGLTALEQTGQRSGVISPSPKVQAAGGLLESITQSQPQAGLGKIQGALYRQGFLKLAKETIKKLLLRQGKTPASPPRPRRNTPPRLKTFERAAPNDLWQTDIMTFMIKGQYRVYIIAFLDDNSRFIVGWGLHRFQTTVHVLEVFRAAIEKHGAPKEVLSDNGRQYYTWRGKSQFTVFLTKLGIRHIRSRPYHPQTMGKVESFWRNLLQESLQNIPLSSFEEAQAKIAEYVEYYNFKRPHQGIGNVTPSDRYFRVEDQVRQIIEQNTAKVQEAQSPMTEYRPPSYIVGNIGGRELRVVAKNAQVMLSEPPAGEMVNSNSGPGEAKRGGFGGSNHQPLD
ncbi:MAG: transposase, partial [Elusimicrobia bacterium]|nr:transposase [Elusimicrobiota bacterium]